MVNALNIAAWSGTYATGLWAAGQVADSTARVVYNTVQYVWQGIGGKGWGTDELKAKVKDNMNQFGHGVKWVVIALGIRQVVARLFSPVAPDFVSNGLALMGWQHVRSPVVDFVVNKLQPVVPFKLTVY